jgi:hypothetical protein
VLPIRAAAFLLSIALISALSACGGKDRRVAQRYTAVNEAYELLDKGQTSRAIALLEKIVSEEPRNTEARVMLASAYMGGAGVDVLSMHDAFKDVLFSRSLSDIFLNGEKKHDAPAPGTTPSDPFTGAPPIEGSEDREQSTPAERMFVRLDEFLNNVRRLLVVLDRFPRVSARKWSLLDQALYNLDQTTLEREIRLYRMFIRMIYLKEVLIHRVIRDPNFGTAYWACTLELSQLHESLSWISNSITSISSDFIEVYPRDGSPFAKIEALFKVFSEELEEFESSTPPGGETATMMGDRRIREAFKCEKFGIRKK